MVLEEHADYRLRIDQMDHRLAKWEPQVRGAERWRKRVVAERHPPHVEEEDLGEEIRGLDQADSGVRLQIRKELRREGPEDEVDLARLEGEDEQRRRPVDLEDDAIVSRGPERVVEIRVESRERAEGPRPEPEMTAPDDIRVRHLPGPRARVLERSVRRLVRPHALAEPRVRLRIDCEPPVHVVASGGELRWGHHGVPSAARPLELMSRQDWNSKGRPREGGVRGREGESEGARVRAAVSVVHREHPQPSVDGEVRPGAAPEV